MTGSFFYRSLKIIIRRFTLLLDCLLDSEVKHMLDLARQLRSIFEWLIFIKNHFPYLLCELHGHLRNSPSGFLIKHNHTSRWQDTEKEKHFAQFNCSRLWIIFRFTTNYIFQFFLQAPPLWISLESIRKSKTSTWT